MANREKIITKFNSRQKTNLKHREDRMGGRQRKHDKKRWRARREEKFAEPESEQRFLQLDAPAGNGWGFIFKKSCREGLTWPFARAILLVDREKID